MIKKVLRKFKRLIFVPKKEEDLRGDDREKCGYY